MSREHIRNLIASKNYKNRVFRVSSSQMVNLSFLRNNCWGKKTTQVVGIPLFLSEGQPFVEVGISQQCITTKKQEAANK